MKFAIFALCFGFCLMGSNARAQDEARASNEGGIRVVDVLDGFGPGQYGLSSVQFKAPLDVIVSWAQGDLGVAAPSSHKDLAGNTVKDLQIYIYKEGLDPDGIKLHDVGAYGGAKVIKDANVETGVNCTSDEKPFLSGDYIKVSENDVLCVKTRAGDQYVLTKILKIDANSIRFRVYAGPQTNPYFPGVSDPAPVLASTSVSK